MYRTYVDVVNYVKADKKRYNIDTDEKMQDDDMEIDEGNLQEHALKDEHQVFTEN